MSWNSFIPPIMDSGGKTISPTYVNCRYIVQGAEAVIRGRVVFTVSEPCGSILIGMPVGIADNDACVALSLFSGATNYMIGASSLFGGTNQLAVYPNNANFMPGNNYILLFGGIYEPAGL